MHWRFKVRAWRAGRWRRRVTEVRRRARLCGAHLPGGAGGRGGAAAPGRLLQAHVLQGSRAAGTCHLHAVPAEASARCCGWRRLACPSVVSEQMEPTFVPPTKQSTGVSGTLEHPAAWPPPPPPPAPTSPPFTLRKPGSTVGGEAVLEGEQGSKALPAQTPRVLKSDLLLPQKKFRQARQLVGQPYLPAASSCRRAASSCQAPSNCRQAGGAWCCRRQCCCQGGDAAGCWHIVGLHTRRTACQPGER